MRYLYYRIWIGIASFYKYFSRLLFLLKRVTWKITKTNKTEQAKWISDYNAGFFKFPGGMIDWFAYGILVVSFIFPVIIVTVKSKIDIYTNNNKWYFISIAILIGVFCYYWIYFKNKDWLKDRINKVSKKYYLK